MQRFPSTESRGRLSGARDPPARRDPSASVISGPLYLNVNVYIVACTSAQQNHEQNPMKNPAVAVAVGVAVAVWQWQWQWQLQWQRSSMESQSPRSAQLRVEKRVA